MENTRGVFITYKSYFFLNKKLKYNYIFVFDISSYIQLKIIYIESV